MAGHLASDSITWECGRPLYLDVNRYRCASGPGGGCGGVAVPGATWLAAPRNGQMPQSRVRASDIY